MSRTARHCRAVVAHAVAARSLGLQPWAYPEPLASESTGCGCLARLEPTDCFGKSKILDRRGSNAVGQAVCPVQGTGKAEFLVHLAGDSAIAAAIGGIGSPGDQQVGGPPPLLRAD